MRKNIICIIVLCVFMCICVGCTYEDGRLYFGIKKENSNQSRGLEFTQYLDEEDNTVPEKKDIVPPKKSVISNPSEEKLVKNEPDDSEKLDAELNDGDISDDDVQTDLSSEFAGSIDKRIIQKVVHQHANELRSCYERQLVKVQGLSGRIVVIWIISPQGFVTSAIVKETTMNNQDVESCVINSVKSWRFPVPKGSGMVKVEYPFVFEIAQKKEDPQ